ncbi:MAG: hypothetical protein ACYC7E_16945 [Armatimonadota bacterium]
MYYAITRQQGRWVYVSSGCDPDEVYLDAMDAITAQDGDVEETELTDEPLALSPAIERQLDALRVVTEEEARVIYTIAVPSSLALE